VWQSCAAEMVEIAVLDDSLPRIEEKQWREYNGPLRVRSRLSSPTRTTNSLGLGFPANTPFGAMAWRFSLAVEIFR
jgi:hypothetical protein